MHKELLRYFYKKQINFFINNEQICLPEAGHGALQHWFKVAIGKTRRPAGIGFLAKTDIQGNWLENFLGKKIIATSLPAGLYISTFGKIIKGGWEWLGIVPKNALTFRKAVQEAVMPLLEQLGENREAAPISPDKLIKPLNRVISGTLNTLLGDFPELEGLIGSGRSKMPGRKEGAKDKDNADSLSGYENKDADSREKQKQNDEEQKQVNIEDQIPKGIADPSKKREVRARTSGLRIALSDISDSPDMLLGRIIDNILTINTLHPAWLKAKKQGMEEYHILITVASVLSEFLEEQKSPQEFLNRFLQSWAKAEEEGKTRRMF